MAMKELRGGKRRPSQNDRPKQSKLQCREITYTFPPQYGPTLKTNGADVPIIRDGLLIAQTVVKTKIKPIRHTDESVSDMPEVAHKSSRADINTTH